MANAHQLYGRLLGARRNLVASDNNDMGCRLALGYTVFGGMGVNKNKIR